MADFLNPLVLVSVVALVIGIGFLAEWLERKKELYQISRQLQNGEPTCGTCAKRCTKLCLHGVGLTAKMRPACEQFDLSPQYIHIGEAKGFFYTYSLRVLAIIATIGALAWGCFF